MRVLLADKLAAFVPEALESAGAAVTSDPSLKGDALEDALRQVDPEVLVVRSTKISARHLNAATSLSLIIRAGAGVNTIDVAGASARGVYVANCPGRNAQAVAELTFGHLINMDRRISDNVAALRAHRWQKKHFGKARGLHGRTLAVLGMGLIGQEVVSRAHAFGIHVQAWSRSLTPEKAAALGVTYAATPLDACRGAHMLSVHLAKTPATVGLVDRELLEALQPGAYVVNTSRGGIIDEDALQQVIATRGIRAGLDVFTNEPGSSDPSFDDHAIADNPSIYGTHHIGASTDQATESVGREVLRIVGCYRESGGVPNCVNLATESAATHMLVVRHEDCVGVLAGVLSDLREDHVNVQEMENIIFKGGGAACARIQLGSAPTPDTLARIRNNASIFAASLVSLER